MTLGKLISNLTNMHEMSCLKVDNIFLSLEARLVEDGNAGCGELGLQASNPNAPTKLVVVENTPQVTTFAKLFIDFFCTYACHNLDFNFYFSC